MTIRKELRWTETHGELCARTSDGLYRILKGIGTGRDSGWGATLIFEPRTGSRLGYLRRTSRGSGTASAREVLMAAAARHAAA